MGAPAFAPGPRVRWADVAVCSLALALTTNGPAYAFIVHVRDEGFSFELWPYAFPVWVLGVLGIVWLARPAPDALDPKPAAPALVVAAYATWIALSATWSVLGAESARRVPLFAAVTVFGVALARRPVVTHVLAVTIAGLVTTVASAVVVVADPDIGRSPIDELGRGDFFRGIFGNRNSLGPVCVLTVVGLLGVVSIWRRRAVLVAALAAVALQLWLLAGARSATAVVALVAAMSAFVFGAVVDAVKLRWPHRRTVTLAVVVPAVAVATVLVLNGPQLRLLGRDGSLSDRRSIWSRVLDIVGDRPFGFGYSSFWDSDLAWPLMYGRLDGVQFGSAHSGVFESLLSAGWLGGALFVAVLSVAAVGALRWLLVDTTGMARWWLALLTFVVVEHLVESFVLWHSYLWILLVAGTVVPWWQVHAATRGPASAVAGPPVEAEGAPTVHA